MLGHELMRWSLNIINQNPQFLAPAAKSCKRDIGSASEKVFLGFPAIFLLLNSLEREMSSRYRYKNSFASCQLYSVGETLRLSTRPRDGIQNGRWWQGGVTLPVGLACHGRSCKHVPVREIEWWWSRSLPPRVIWCRHSLSVEPRTLTCPFEQSNLSAWLLVSWHPYWFVRISEEDSLFFQSCLLSNVTVTPSDWDF